MSGRDELAVLLRAQGHLTRNWDAAFGAVDRAGFIPAEIWLDADGYPTPISRVQEPDRWARAVYSNNPIVTRYDDGATSWPARGELVTSSSSQPSMVLAMLDALDVQDGQRVLEIGTGTGWNAALLCERLGDEQVVTIELDPVLVERARAALAAAGYKPAVIHADGTDGWPAGAPFDRIIATASAETIPPAWITQTRPGGRIIAPWGPPMSNEHLVSIDVAGDGTATGRIVGTAAFMRIRAQRWRVTDEPDEFDDIAAATEVELAPREVLGDDARLAVALRLGEVRAIFEPGPGGKEVLWMLAAESWACVSATAARQAGVRRLWDEAVDAYRWWVGLGRPDRTRLGITVEQDRQWVWWDDPACSVSVRRTAGRTR